MKRNLNHVSEVELNFMGVRCIGKSIERLLRCGFELFDNIDYLVNSRLVHQTARSPDDQTNVFVKLDVWGKLHIVHSIDSLRVVRDRWLRRQQFERDTEPLRGCFAAL